MNFFLGVIDFISNFIVQIVDETQPLIPVLGILIVCATCRLCAEKFKCLRKTYLYFAGILSLGICWWAWGWKFPFWGFFAVCLFLILILGIRNFPKVKRDGWKFRVISRKTNNQEEILLPIQKNRHFIDRLDDFLKEKDSAGAIMISGSWGCGKTFFINKYIDYRREKFPERKCIYCSVNGASSREEFLWKIRGKLGFKRILKDVAKNDVGFSFDLVGFTLPFVQLAELVFPDKWEKQQIDLVVIDDLERCISEDFTVSQVFSCINELVEHQGMRVCVLCDEEKIHGNEKDIEKSILDRDVRCMAEKDKQKQKNIREEILLSEYYQKKEKVFRSTFKLEASYEEFLKLALDAPQFSVLKSEEAFLLGLINAEKHQNLRVIREALNDCAQSVEVLLRDSALKKYDFWDSIFKGLIIEVFCVSVRVRSGVRDWRELSAHWSPEFFKKDICDFAKDYHFPIYAPKQLFRELFGFLYEGIPYSGDSLVAYFRDVTHTSGSLASVMWHFPDVDDEIFREIWDDLEPKLKGEVPFTVSEIRFAFPLWEKIQKGFPDLKEIYSEKTLLDLGKEILGKATDCELEEFIQDDWYMNQCSLRDELVEFARGTLVRNRGDVFSRNIYSFSKDSILQLLKDLKSRKIEEIYMYDWSLLEGNRFFSAFKKSKTRSLVNFISLLDSYNRTLKSALSFQMPEQSILSRGKVVALRNFFQDFSSFVGSCRALAMSEKNYNRACVLCRVQDFLIKELCGTCLKGLEDIDRLIGKTGEG